MDQNVADVFVIMDLTLAVSGVTCLYSAGSSDLLPTSMMLISEDVYFCVSSIQYLRLSNEFCQKRCIRILCQWNYV